MSKNYELINNAQRRKSKLSVNKKEAPPYIEWNVPLKHQGNNISPNQNREKNLTISRVGKNIEIHCFFTASEDINWYN